jgi:hypothetical protein
MVFVIYVAIKHNATIQIQQTRCNFKAIKQSNTIFKGLVGKPLSEKEASNVRKNWSNVDFEG